MIAVVYIATKQLKLPHQGINPDLVVSHYFRAEGAMVLKLHGYDDTNTNKIGRWNRLTCLKYTQNQIEHTSKYSPQNNKHCTPFTQYCSH